MRQTLELFIFVKLLNSKPCGILGYVASDVYKRNMKVWEHHAAKCGNDLRVY